MFAMPQRRASLVALLLLIISGCAWASETSEKSNESGLDLCNLKISKTEETQWGKIVVTNINDSVASESTLTGTTQGKVDAGQAEETRPSPPQLNAVGELQLRRRKAPTSAEAAQITSPPLLPRQDQSQIDQLNARIQSLQQSAQQALQALSDASRSVSQASQQLSQSSQQLSQDSSRLSVSSQSLSLALSVATQSEASLTGALSAAISSGSSAFASCTNSASSVLALVSGDAVTKVGAALAQATVARTEADREVDRAQSSAVSITQAAAIIVGASAGSSLITIIIILLVLRYRRKKRREREAQAEAERGSMDNSPRPGTSGSYNSMTGAARDTKDPPPMTGTTAVTTGPERFQSVRIVDVSRNGSKNSATNAAGARSKPESFLGERLSKLGITRRPAGEALTTNYVQHAGSGRKPVVTLADPPPPLPLPSKQAKREQEPGASSKTITTPTFSVFPKVDPDPKGTHMLKTVREEDQQRPTSSGAATLQAWLQTATISPFGPLEPPPAKPSAVAAVDKNNNNNSNAPMSKGAPGPKRLSEVKWPLQESSTSGGGLGRSATDASSRYSQATVTEGGEIPVVMVQNNPAAAGNPQVVGGGKRRGPGLPGSVRKLPAGSVRDVSAGGRDQRLGR